MKNWGFNILLIFTMCVATVTTGYAQDPTFSQYNLNQYYYNPAYTGVQGGYEILATSRSQWPNIPGKIFPGPLSTSVAVFDAYVGKGPSYSAGAGAFAMQDIEGEGYLTTSTFGVSYAQHFGKIGGNKSDALPRFQLSLGFKAYLNSISINWDKLVFSDQLNIDQGILGQTPSDKVGISQKYTGDMDAGLLIKNNFNGQDRWYNEVGFAMAHIVSPSTALVGPPTAETRIPRKYVATYRSTVRLGNKHFYLGPTLLFENQNNFYEFNSGVDLFIKPNLNSDVIPIGFSLSNRLSFGQLNLNTNAFIVGITHKGLMGKSNTVYTIGFAADFPYSGLAMITKGAYEFTVGVVIPAHAKSDHSQCPYGTFNHTYGDN
jgi:type IX secretion system PorP/SprF family membrane protein